MEEQEENPAQTNLEPPPLAINITVVKPEATYVPMEEIIIEVKQLFLKSFRMESIELNPERTHILLFSNVVRTLLSGNSYVELHGVNTGGKTTIQSVGFAHDVAENTQRISYINLSTFVRPLPPGKYTVMVMYRYGDTDEETAKSNFIDIEIIPCKVATADFMWSNDLQDLEALLTVNQTKGSKIHWIYQTFSSPRNNPTIPLRAVNLDINSLITVKSIVPPRLAVNGTKSRDFRYITWLESTSFCWAKIKLSPDCAVSSIFNTLELSTIVESYQRYDGGLSTILIGRGPRTKLPVATLINIDKDGEQEYDDEEYSSDENNSDSDDNKDDDNDNDDSDDENSKEEEQEREISEFKLLGVATIPEFTAVTWFKNDSGKLVPSLFFNQVNQVFRFDFATRKSHVIFKGPENSIVQGLRVTNVNDKFTLFVALVEKSQSGDNMATVSILKANIDIKHNNELIEFTSCTKNSQKVAADLKAVEFLAEKDYAVLSMQSAKEWIVVGIDELKKGHIDKEGPNKMPLKAFKVLIKDNDILFLYKGVEGFPALHATRP